MLANNNKPETQLFELLTASFYLKNGYEVAFIPENSIVWPDGKTKKSPDMLVKSGELEFYVECKRADKQTRYSKSEEQAWANIWHELSEHMHEVAPWNIINLVFHEQVADVTPEEVIQVVNLALKGGTGKAKERAISVEIRAIDKLGLLRHYREFSVRPNRGARRIRKKSYAKVFRASVRAETSRLPVCGSAARRNRRLG